MSVLYGVPVIRTVVTNLQDVTPPPVPSQACATITAAAAKVLQTHDFPPRVRHRALEIFDTYTTLAGGAIHVLASTAACALIASKVETYKRFMNDTDALGDTVGCSRSVLCKHESSVLIALGFDVAFPTTYQLATYASNEKHDEIDTIILRMLSKPGLLVKYGRKALCAAALAIVCGEVPEIIATAWLRDETSAPKEDVWHPVARLFASAKKFPLGDDVVLPHVPCEPHHELATMDTHARKMADYRPLTCFVGVKGSCGEMYVTQSDRSLIIKTFKYSPADIHWSTIHEISMLKLLPPFEHVCGLAGPGVLHIRSQTFAFYKRAYCDLQRIFERRSPEVKRRLARPVIKQILEGLSYVHSFGLVHRDVKPGNVLVFRDRSVKLADFGFCSYNAMLRESEHLCGTLDYVAPELIKEGKFDEKCDLWAVGCLLYQFVRDKKFLKCKKESEEHHALIDTYPSELDVSMEKLYREMEEEPEDLSKLLFGLLKLQPETRLSADEALEEPFFIRDEAPEDASHNAFYKRKDTMDFMARHVRSLFT